MAWTDASLSFRDRAVGGPVAAPKATPSNALTRWSRLVLLVHGYNNSQAEALVAYEGFVDRQRESARDPEAPVAGGRLVAVYWPGDEAWGPAGFLCYMNSIPKAQETARRLAAALRDAAETMGSLSIDIVGHSMGCRLVLQLLDELDQLTPRGLQVRRVVLMAAAVPVDKLIPGQAYGLRMGYDACLAEAAKALYSPDDRVLKFAFPMGQTLAGSGEGVFPTALGHDLWGHPQRPANLYQDRVAGADHSDYWGWKPDTLECSRDAAQRIREFLQFPDAGDRQIAERSIRDAALLPDRETPTRA